MKLKAPIKNLDKASKQSLASSFRANNLQIRRSHFRGVVNFYFTIFKVTLVLVNNARHLLKHEVRRQIWGLKLVNLKHENIAHDETDSIEYYSDYNFERCY